MIKSLALLALLFGARPALAQTPPAVAIAKGDTVIILVTAPPQPFHGFIVSGAHTDTVRPVTDPQALPTSIGRDYPAVLAAAEVEDAVGLMRHLQTEQFSANLLTVFFPSLGAAAGRSWRAGGHQPGTTAQYRLQFIDARGRPGEAVDLEVVMNDVLPLAPTALKVRTAETHVTLAWSYSRQIDLAFGFNIYRALGGAEMQRINEAVVLRDQSGNAGYIDYDVRAGSSMSYEVRALDLVGREGPPAELRVVVRDSTPPAPAARITGQVQAERILLVWPMAPEPDALGYFVQRSVGLDKPYTRLHTAMIPLISPTYTDTTARAGTQYFYQVVTVDSARNESVPSNPESVLPVDRTAPPPPSALVATVLPQHRISLDWRPSPSRDAVGYMVYRSDAEGNAVQLTPQPVQPPFVDAGPDSVGIPEGRTYVMSVTAIDDVENESEELRVTVTIPDDVAPLPATGLNIENVQGRYVNIRWSESASGDVKAYELSRAGMAWTLPVAAPRIVVDSTITAGSNYTYSLIAIDSAGNRSNAEKYAFAFADPTPPSAPRNAAARRVTEGVRVVWERVVAADLSGYLVFRSEIPTGLFTQITAQPVAGLEFIDPDAPVQAFYQVRAVDQSQNRSAASPTVRAIDP